MKRIFTALGLLAGAALAAPELSPQGIIVNPIPTDLQVRVWVNKDPAKTGNPVYQIGERIQVSVQVNQEAYVYIFSVKSTGEIGLILPNAFDQNNLLRAGETRTFPPATGARYSLDVGGPEGQDRVLAVASRQPLSLAQIANIQTGQVNVQGADNLARALSIVVTPLPERDWVSNVAFFIVGRAAVTPVQPVQPATGTLSVNSTPSGAQVLVEGRVVGNTPLNLVLRPGRVDLELRLGGYQAFRTSAQIRPGETTVINANLTPVVQEGLLQINSNPQGAQVLVNGRVVGNTPLNLTVQPGRYDIELRLGGYQGFRTSVTVGNGQTVPVSVNLQALRGALEVFTNVEARIFLDGREVGQTRGGFLRLEDVEPGNVQLVALTPGFRAEVRDVRLEPGRVLQVRLNLNRAR
ncbi:MAG: PEGA domain-containing protein [Meiothermus sp.]|uniref:PEGA domain-containing protein n=1 Tax=Meiothermus sp. TaxID=1955249 RepID=UPI0025EC0A6B|nr:PEGA domain-containing protein [Meiothermus sp.]MCS7068609.1 PEGA domain-containing protein [Meiothermus sp.]MCX7601074.1 PEGA domain-containing protein [Meiothermus sp.]MDW8424960.1 PEGA domain-containing protein [Meiothermus sp.]